MRQQLNEALKDMARCLIEIAEEGAIPHDEVRPLWRLVNDMGEKLSNMGILYVTYPCRQEDLETYLDLQKGMYDDEQLR